MNEKNFLTWNTTMQLAASLNSLAT